MRGTRNRPGRPQGTHVIPVQNGISVPLGNVQQERFAQLVASGIAVTVAYASAGYSASTQAAINSGAAKLHSRAAVKHRIAELMNLRAQSKVNQVEFDRQRVISRLDQLSRKAEKEGKFTAAVRAEELIGKELGMFAEQAKLTFDGDLQKLSKDQMEKMRELMEQIAARRDPVWYEEYKKRKGGKKPEGIEAAPGGPQSVLAEPTATTKLEETPAREADEPLEAVWELVDETIN